ncbi:MAG: PilZ domain-containing protein [Myxococcota bacterium]
MAERRAGKRRKYLRIPTDQVISFAELDRPDQLAVSRDVSLGGIRFEAVGCEINLGDLLRVTFNVGRRTIVATGRVVWAVDTDPITQEVGIAFDDIDDAALALIEEAIEPASDLAGPF